jgi:hypothetical protein
MAAVQDPPALWMDRVYIKKDRKAFGKENENRRKKKKERKTVRVQLVLNFQVSEGVKT